MNRLAFIVFVLVALAFTGAVLIVGAGAGFCAGLGEDIAFVLFLPALVDGLVVGSFVGAIDGRAVVGLLVFGAMMDSPSWVHWLVPWTDSL